jgi:hypothetical protein
MPVEADGASATLELLLQADDLPAALERHRARLDADLLALVNANAAAARAGGEAELAEGLVTLAEYVRQVLGQTKP